MLSFHCTNNQGALEQVIYPSIAPVEMFSIEDCVFSGMIRRMCICMNVAENQQVKGISKSNKKV